MMRRISTLILVAALSPALLHAQAQVTARTAVLFESYNFSSPSPVDKVSEFTVPLGVNVDFSDRVALALSTGFVSVDFTGADPAIADASISGLLDTELRLSYALIPGKLILLATGAVPTGTETVAEEELGALVAIASDVIGFYSKSTGTGGNVGGGFAAAVPVGRLALGIGGTVRNSFSYTPIDGTPTDLKPGFEFRIRTGLEGPLARRTYVRLAGVFAQRGKDELGGQTANGIGNRWIGYLSVNQGVGSSSLTLYGFDVLRTEPKLEATAAGSQVLPEGNLVAVGFRWSFPATSRLTVVPRAEYRNSQQATMPDADLEKVGESLRFGAEFRVAVSPTFNLVFQGSGLTGTALLAGTDSDVTGFRAGVQLEIRP